MVGTDFNDYMAGNALNNSLTGGLGSDTFVFLPGFAKDTVTDFVAGQDFLQFDHTTFANANAALAAATDDGNGNVVITFDANHTVTLLGQSVANLHISDFSIT